MYRYLKVIALSACLVGPALVGAQDRDHQDRDHQDRDRQDRGQNNQQSVRYEDRAHKDFHEWNPDEDQAYRRYLQEHHRKYHEFSKAKKSEQSDYWKWRHA